MDINDLIKHFNKVQENGKDSFLTCCPAHNDTHPSLSITKAADGRILLHCFAGCRVEDIVKAAGLTMKDLYSEACTPSGTSVKREIAAEYIYHDMQGNASFKKIRYSDKSFSWQYFDGTKWNNGRGGRNAPLYKQFEYSGSKYVYLVEGEKDADNMQLLGFAAVSAPDGAKSKWCDEYTEFFAGKRVCIIQDNDKPGKDFARLAAQKICDKAELVKILDLSKIWQDIPEKGDVSDLLMAFPKDGKEKLAKLSKEEKPFDKAQTEKERIGIICLSDVESTKTDWLWYPYIPKGKVTLMTADPGTGKTFLSLYLTARVSDGGAFYLEANGREPMNAVYQTAEDGVADTIKPRLELMSPNFDNIYMIDESNKGLSLSDERVESIMKLYKPALMIFDPLQAYLGSDVDMHRANEVRPVLSRIGKLAEKYNCAVIFIMHNSKMSSNKAIYRSLGSIDIPAIARSMLILGKNPKDPSEIIMCHEKSSLTEHGVSLIFNIDANNKGIIFKGTSDLKADDLLNTIHRREKRFTKSEKLEERLTKLLENNGYADYDDVIKLKNELYIGDTLLKEVKKKLKIKSIKVGFKNPKHYWLASGADKEALKKELQSTICICE